MALMTGSSCATRFIRVQMPFHMLLHTRSPPVNALLILAIKLHLLTAATAVYVTHTYDLIHLLNAAQLAVSAFSSSS